MRADEYTNMFVLEDRFWWYRGIHELIVSHVRREGAGRRLRILDAGCGTGKLMTLLSPLAEVQGIDSSEEALRYCRERGLSRVAVADLNEWESAGATYDVITCIDVLCHETLRDVSAVLGRFRKALTPGGLLILNVPAFESLRRQHDVVVQTIRRYRKEQLLPLLTDLGFAIEIATYRLPLLFFLIRLKKALVPDRKGETPRSDLVAIPHAANAVLWQMNRIENQAILSGVRFPVGSSLFVMARRKEGGAV